MKSLIRTFTALFLVAGALSAFAAPAYQPSTPLRVSIALPVAQFDFSDLDVRDEFNRPVASAVVRVRFETLLNRELNRLLVENLTPARRAWMALLASASNAFGDWLSGSTERVVTTSMAFLRGQFHLLAAVHWRGVVPAMTSTRLVASSAGDSLSLLLRSIASTRLLR